MKTIKEFLQIALQPVGSTMYIWGGGWNETDTGTGAEGSAIGISSRWAEFAALQDAEYDYNTTRYQTHDGLDCSGYVGWAVYNALETVNKRPGYVMSASKMAKTFAENGLGTYFPSGNSEIFQAGNIMSMDEHVWICLGRCKDGSVVILHSSPPGVGIYGTMLIDGTKSEAVILAETYMKQYYPLWYERYPNCMRGSDYITDSSSMRWRQEALSDPEGIQEMSAEEVLKCIFNEE